MTHRIQIHYIQYTDGRTGRTGGVTNTLHSHSHICVVCLHTVAQTTAQAGNTVCSHVDVPNY